MKEIKLGINGKYKGKYVAIVDDADFEYLSQWRWHVNIEKKTNYARRSFKENGKQKSVTMHWQLMQPSKNMEIDHIDHNGLNNQRVNLRICTRSENSCNKVGYGVSKYLGVYFEKGRRKYKAQIRANGKTKNLGYFETEESAALAYNIAAKEFHGEYANLNIVSEQQE